MLSYLKKVKETLSANSLQLKKPNCYVKEKESEGTVEAKCNKKASNLGFWSKETKIFTYWISRQWAFYNTTPGWM